MANYVPFNYGLNADEEGDRLAEYRPGIAARQLEEQVYGPPRPAPQAPTMGHLDNATLAVLRYMQSNPMPRPKNFGQGLAGGFVQGLVGHVGSGIAQRQDQYKSEKKAAADDEEERKRFRSDVASKLAIEGWRLRKQKTASQNDVTDVTGQKEILAGLAKRGVIVPPPDKSGRVVVPTSWLGPRDLSLQNKREAELSRMGDRMAPEDIQFYAQMAAAGATIDPWVLRGMHPADRNAFAAAWRRSSGNGYNAAGAKAKYRAEASALRSLTDLDAKAGAFSGFIDKNIEVMEGIMQNIKDTGTQWANGPVRSLVAGMGDVTQKQFNFALESVNNEVARILRSPNLTGVLTNEAKKDMEDVLRGDFTIPQLEGVIKVIRMDKQNRTDAYGEARDQLLRTIGGGAYTGGGVQPQAPQQPQPKPRDPGVDKKLRDILFPRGPK